MASGWAERVRRALIRRRARLRRLWRTPAFRDPTRLWIGWAVVLLLFQAAAGMRLAVVGPDTAYGWTHEYSADPPRTGIGLSHVRWDSYHYLRLARLGYGLPRTPPTTRPTRPDARRGGGHRRAGPAAGELSGSPARAC